MIAIGQHHTLTILRHTSVGLFLGHESGEDVLLPNKYCPEDFAIGDQLNVFVYRDFAERKIATNLQPKILLHEFALLQVTAVSDVGAFMDWGLEKELMVPFKEQRQKMQEGRWYIVYLDLDPMTDRLYATNKIEKRLSNESLTVNEGDQVDVMIMQKTDLGFSVIVNNAHKGLIYSNEVFRELRIGEKVKGFVKRIREGNKIDISLQAIGFDNFNEGNCASILDALAVHNGFIKATDKSSPDEIYAQFGMSKKAFKKAIGTLYKQKKIILQSDGIKLV